MILSVGDVLEMAKNVKKIIIKSTVHALYSLSTSPPLAFSSLSLSPSPLLPLPPLRLMLRILVLSGCVIGLVRWLYVSLRSTGRWKYTRQYVMDHRV